MKKFSFFSLFFGLFLFGLQDVLFAQSAIWNGSVNTAWYDDSINAPVYNISTAEELAGLATLVNAGTQNFSERTIRLTQDIFLNDTANWRNWGSADAATGAIIAPARNWTAIGTVAHTFQGTFDGQGHIVLGVFIYVPAADNQGFFGHVTNSTMRNIGVVSSFINGRDNVGGLVGHDASGSTITNSHNTGAVRGAIRVGGLVGWSATDISVTHSFNSGVVSGTNLVGGLVGWNDGTVTSSHNTGVVNGVGAVGGLVGRNDGTVIHSSNTGAVSGNEAVGGLVGTNAGSVANSHNTASVIGIGTDIGGLVGWNDGTVTSSYNTGVVSGVEAAGGLVGSNSGTVTSSYNTGDISGNIRVGGLAGANGGTITNSYNIGEVGGVETVGGLVGWSVPGSTVSSSFFLAGTAVGVGTGDAVGESRTQAQFNSGEVAQLLQGTQANPIWGHTVLGGNEFPMLAFQDTSVTQVRRVSFTSVDPAYSGNHYFLNSTLLVSPIQRLGYSAVWRDPDGNEYTHTTRVLSDLVLTFNRWEIHTTVQREPDFSVKLGPNPIQDELIVTISGASEYIGKTVRLSVFDLNGRRFASETIEINGVYDEKTVAVSSLPSGVCVLVLEVEGFDAKRLVFTKVER